MPTKTKYKGKAPTKFVETAIRGGIGAIGNIVSEARKAKAAGEDYSFGQGLGDFFTGAAGGLGMTGLSGSSFVSDAGQKPSDMTTDPSDVAPKPASDVDKFAVPPAPAVVPVDPSQSQLGGLFANDPLINQSPQKMKESRTKNISAVEMSYNPLKMSYKEAKSANKMMEISGAATMMKSTEKHDDNPALKGGQVNLPDKLQAGIISARSANNMKYEKAAAMMSGQSPYSMKYKK